MIKQLIEQIATDSIKNEQFYSLVCKVLKVDEDLQTCDCEPLNGDAEIFDVRLKSNLKNDDGILQIPVVGSNVIVTFINKQTAFVSVYSDIERFEIKLKDINLDINENEVVFNKGSNGGMVVSSSVSSKLNSIESDINRLKTLFKAWTPLPADGGVALKTVLTAWFGLSLSKTTADELENEKVKH